MHYNVAQCCLFDCKSVALEPAHCGGTVVQLSTAGMSDLGIAGQDMHGGHTRLAAPAPPQVQSAVAITGIRCAIMTGPDTECY